MGFRRFPAAAAEQAARLLPAPGDLERDGLIRISYSTIEVPDPARLAARA
jgi:hypothetical protein